MSRLATPAEFEEAAALVSSDELAEKLVLGPDPEAYLAGIESYQAAGFDHVYIHQIGPNQEGFSNFASAKSYRSLPSESSLPRPEFRENSALAALPARTCTEYEEHCPIALPRFVLSIGPSRRN